MGKILLQDAKPSGLTGIVELANGCIYLYAYERGSCSVVGACWICNTKRTPRNFNQGQIEKGMFPRMPTSFCNHPRKGIKINPANLKLQWSSDTNVLILRERDKVIGIIADITKKYSIPYARYASGETPYAHSLESLSPELKELLSIEDPILPYVDNSKEDKERAKQERKLAKEAGKNKKSTDDSDKENKKSKDDSDKENKKPKKKNKGAIDGEKPVDSAVLHADGAPEQYGKETADTDNASAQGDNSSTDVNIDAPANSANENSESSNSQHNTNDKQQSGV